MPMVHSWWWAGSGAFLRAAWATGRGEVAMPRARRGRRLTVRLVAGRAGARTGCCRRGLSAVVESLVDGLVAQMPCRAVGVGLAQIRRDQRRTPLLLELVLDDPAQLRLSGQQWPSRRRDRSRARVWARSPS